MNVAVAWTLNLSRDPRLIHGKEERGGPASTPTHWPVRSFMTRWMMPRLDHTSYVGWSIERRTLPGSEYTKSAWSGPSSGPYFYVSHTIVMSPNAPARPDAPGHFVPLWAPELSPLDSTSDPDSETLSVARTDGWPMLALRGTIACTDGTAIDNHGNAFKYRGTTQRTSLVVKALPGNSLDDDDLRFLPFGPIWPGFAINTIFYAAILWLLFAFPFALRRQRRIKRGLCPSCAYPIGDSPVCTECGRPLRIKS